MSRTRCSQRPLPITHIIILVTCLYSLIPYLTMPAHNSTQYLINVSGVTNGHRELQADTSHVRIGPAATYVSMIRVYLGCRRKVGREENFSLSYPTSLSESKDTLNLDLDLSHGRTHPHQSYDQHVHLS